jgi:hypothetical protein
MAMKVLKGYVSEQSAASRCTALHERDDGNGNDFHVGRAVPTFGSRHVEKRGRILTWSLIAEPD